jgi:hypothetical protein
MRRAKTLDWSVIVCALLASTACGTKQAAFKGHGNDQKRDEGHAKGLAIGEGEPATKGGADGPQPAPDTEQESDSGPKADGLADVEVLFESGAAADGPVDLCKLPESGYSLLGWGAPTGQGGHEAQEIIKACGFKSKYATCAFGLDPTTNAISVLGCEAYGGPDPLNHAVCIQAAAARTQARQDDRVSQYQCIRSELFGQAESLPAILIAADDVGAPSAASTADTDGSADARE